MNEQVHLLPDGCGADTGKKLTGLKSVTIHWTGPLPGQTPEQVRSWWARDGKDLPSAHWVIKDSEALRCWPDDKVAWHCGNMEGNMTSISIEVIPMNKEGEFSALSKKTLAALLDKYYKGLPLLRHYDWSGKECPAFYVQNGRWHDLLKEIGR